MSRGATHVPIAARGRAPAFPKFLVPPTPTWYHAATAFCMVIKLDERGNFYRVTHPLHALAFLHFRVFNARCRRVPWNFVTALGLKK